MSSAMRASPSVGDAVDPVAGVAQRVEQDDHRRRRVEPDGVADPAPLRRVGRQHDGDPLVRRWRLWRRRGQPHGGAGHPGHPVGHRPVGHDGHAEIVAVVDDLLERQRDRDDPAVELGQGHRPGGVEGGQADVVLLPGGPAGGGGDGLDDGHVEAGQHGHVPRVGCPRGTGLAPWPGRW